MQVLARYPAGGSGNSNRVACGNCVTRQNEDLGQMAVRTFESLMCQNDMNSKQPIIPADFNDPFTNSENRIVPGPQINAGMKGISSRNRMNPVTISGTQ